MSEKDQGEEENGKIYGESDQEREGTENLKQDVEQNTEQHLESNLKQSTEKNQAVEQNSKDDRIEKYYRKPFFQQWWFWLIIVLLLIWFVSSDSEGASAPVGEINTGIEIVEVLPEM